MTSTLEEATLKATLADAIMLGMPIGIVKNKMPPYESQSKRIIYGGAKYTD